MTSRTTIGAYKTTIGSNRDRKLGNAIPEAITVPTGGVDSLATLFIGSNTPTSLRDLPKQAVDKRSPAGFSPSHWELSQPNSFISGGDQHPARPCDFTKFHKAPSLIISKRSRPLQPPRLCRPYHAVSRSRTSAPDCVALASGEEIGLYNGHVSRDDEMLGLIIILQNCTT